jgi:hypothetical protein
MPEARRVENDNRVEDRMAKTAKKAKLTRAQRYNSPEARANRAAEMHAQSGSATEESIKRVREEAYRRATQPA